MVLRSIPGWADWLGNIVLPILSFGLVITLLLIPQRRLAIQLGWFAVVCAGLACAIRNLEIGTLDRASTFSLVMLAFASRSIISLRRFKYVPLFIRGLAFNAAVFTDANGGSVELPVSHVTRVFAPAMPSDNIAAIVSHFERGKRRVG